jgi:hypothetical protein
LKYVRKTGCCGIANTNCTIEIQKAGVVEKLFTAKVDNCREGAKGGEHFIWNILVREEAK